MLRIIVLSFVLYFAVLPLSRGEADSLGLQNIPPITYFKVVKGDNFHVLEKEGIKVIASLINDNALDINGEAKPGSVNFQIRNNRENDISISRIVLAIRDGDGIPLFDPDGRSQSENIDFTISLRSIETAKLSFDLNYPTDYSSKRYRYIVRINDLIKVVGNSSLQLAVAESLSQYDGQK